MVFDSGGTPHFQEKTQGKTPPEIRPPLRPGHGSSLQSAALASLSCRSIRRFCRSLARRRFRKYAWTSLPLHTLALTRNRRGKKTNGFQRETQNVFAKSCGKKCVHKKLRENMQAIRQMVSGFHKPFRGLLGNADTKNTLLFLTNQPAEDQEIRRRVICPT